MFVIKIFLPVGGCFLFINKGYILYIFIALRVYILLKPNAVIHFLINKIQFVINKRVCCSAIR